MNAFKEYNKEPLFKNWILKKKENHPEKKKRKCISMSGGSDGGTEFYRYRSIYSWLLHKTLIIS